MSETASPAGFLNMRQQSGGTASFVFKVLFWVHQAVLGLPSVGFGIQLLAEGKSEGILNVIGFLLAWIGGTLVWGFAALMHQRSIYDLPPVLAAIDASVERMEAMQAHARAVSAVADAVDTLEVNERDTAVPPAVPH